MHAPLFVTGMMGCGKTTVGRVLALRWGVTVIDLDERVERLFGRTVPELFAAGEPSFRAHERAALDSLLSEPGFGAREVIVTTGGGAVLDPHNREAMDRVGTRVYLEVGVDELVRRLRLAHERGEPGRPLLDPLLEEDRDSLRSRVAQLLAARRSGYRAGARCIDAEADPETVADRVALELGDVPARARTQDCEAV